MFIAGLVLSVIWSDWPLAQLVAAWLAGFMIGFILGVYSEERRSNDRSQDPRYPG